MKRNCKYEEEAKPTILMAEKGKDIERFFSSNKTTVIKHSYCCPILIYINRHL